MEANDSKIRGVEMSKPNKETRGASESPQTPLMRLFECTNSVIWQSCFCTAGQTEEETGGHGGAVDTHVGLWLRLLTVWWRTDLPTVLRLPAPITFYSCRFAPSNLSPSQGRCCSDGCFYDMEAQAGVLCLRFVTLSTN